LCRSDKLYAKAVAALPIFCLDDSDLYQRPPSFPYRILPHLVDDFIEKNGKQGAAIEHRSLLGRLLRLFPNQKDPEVIQLFQDNPHTVKEWNDRNANLVTRIDTLQRKAHDIVMALLRSGGNAKEQTMKWFTVTVQCLQEVSKSHPNPIIAPSLGFAFNTGVLAISVAKPIWKDEGKKKAADKIRSIDMGYFLLAESKKIFPPDAVDKIIIDSSVIPSSSSSISSASAVNSSISDLTIPLSRSNSTEPSFITQSFFLCSRVLYTSHAPCLRRLEEDWRLMNHPYVPEEQRRVRKIESNYLLAALSAKSYSIEIVSYCVTGITALMLALESNPPLTSVTSAAAWKIGPEELTPHQAQLLTSVPLSFLSDIVTFLCFAADHDDILSSIMLTQHPSSMEHVLSFTLFFLRRPSFCGTYHFRASLSKLVQRLFSDWLNKEQQNHMHHVKHHGGHGIGLDARRRFSHLLDSSEEARRFLAPCLLHLYGDIEKLLQHEKTRTRIRILGIVKQLWELPSHRLAFRGICCDDEFATFANGILSEINSLLADVTNSLSDIKELQAKMQGPGYQDTPPDMKSADADKLEMCTGIVNHHSQLLLDVLDFLTNLSSDEVSAPTIRHLYFFFLLLTLLCILTFPTDNSRIFFESRCNLRCCSSSPWRLDQTCRAQVLESERYIRIYFFKGHLSQLFLNLFH